MPSDTAYLGQWLRAKSASRQLIEPIDIAIANGKTGKLKHVLSRNRISEFTVTEDQAKQMLLRYIEELEASSSAD